MTNGPSQSTEYALREYNGAEYHLSIRASPGWDRPDDFAVTVYFYDENRDENVSIARIDTDHGSTHFDKLYRRGEPTEDVDYDIKEATKKLQSNWRTYAESYANPDPTA